MESKNIDARLSVRPSVYHIGMSEQCMLFKSVSAIDIKLRIQTDRNYVVLIGY